MPNGFWFKRKPAFTDGSLGFKIKEQINSLFLSRNGRVQNHEPGCWRMSLWHVHGGSTFSVSYYIVSQATS